MVPRRLPHEGPRTFGPIAVALLLVVGCGGDAPEEAPRYEVSDRPLSGVHQGEPWAFAAGDTDAFLSDEDGFFTALFPETYEPCAPFEAPRDLPYLLLSIPTEPGEYRLRLSQSVTFVVRDEGGEINNLIATRGVLVVEEVSETTLRAGLYARYDQDHRVDGYFEVSVCPDSD
jgi:hypothetical protein